MGNSAFSVANSEFCSTACKSACRNTVDPDNHHSPVTIITSASISHLKSLQPIGIQSVSTLLCKLYVNQCQSRVAAMHNSTYGVFLGEKFSENDTAVLQRLRQRFLLRLIAAVLYRVIIEVLLGPFHGPALTAACY